MYNYEVTCYVKNKVVYNLKLLLRREVLVKQLSDGVIYYNTSEGNTEMIVLNQFDRVVINDTLYQDLLEEFEHDMATTHTLEDKYDKALELLIEWNLPCEFEDEDGSSFMDVDSDYCETHCGVDDEQFKVCWDRYIQWRLEEDGSGVMEK